MTRKKVKLAFIENNSSRKATFQKKKEMFSEESEGTLDSMCPYTFNPDVWPSTSGVKKTLPEMDQHKKMVDQEIFLRQRIAKLSKNLKRLGKDNREQEMIEVMFQCWDRSLGRFHLNILDLNDLGYVIDQYQRDINRKIEILGSSSIEMGESSNTAVTEAMAYSSEGIESLAVSSATTAPAATIHEVYSSSSSAAAATFFNSIQQHQHHHQHQRFMEMMNHPDQMSYEHMDNRHNPNHHNPFHHHQHEHQYLHHQQQQQQIPNDSSTALITVSSSSIIDVTSRNPTNDTWFR
ncbi:hypothetical protein EUTSA_v10019717mg [Eutrema salsugineum]|uniref:MADS-box domain-containing protein n=1 Tax=Eutrema salsugineum TaxID=72664 RepID=V4KN34_EUTSA|nr:hypothetical protein EUTSA_v10019717mg [Eutrema salsugineum]